MANEMRDRLVEILGDEGCTKPIPCDICEYKDFYDCHNYARADRLIENGVVVPPCKVGQAVYMLFEGEITPLLITRISTIETVGEFSRCYDATGKNVATSFTDNHIGKTMFLTKSEAEQKLNEMRGE